MNSNFGKRSGNSIEYAPNTVAYEGKVYISPTDDIYLAAGWKYVVNTPPQPEDGYHAVSFTLDENETEIFRVWTYEKDEDPVYTLSKLKCYMALNGMKVQTDEGEKTAWDVVYEWLNANNMWIAFTLANEVRTDHPMFKKGISAVQAMLGLDDVAVEDFIRNCIMED